MGCRQFLPLSCEGRKIVSDRKKVIKVLTNKYVAKNNPFKVMFQIEEL